MEDMSFSRRTSMLCFPTVTAAIRMQSGYDLAGPTNDNRLLPVQCF